MFWFCQHLVAVKGLFSHPSMRYRLTMVEPLQFGAADRIRTYIKVQPLHWIHVDRIGHH